MYAVVLAREQAEDQRVLLALGHEGAASPRPAGFPRLLGPSEWDCFLSVTSVDRIEVTGEPRQATAGTIALGPAPTLSDRHAAVRSDRPRLAINSSADLLGFYGRTQARVRSEPLARWGNAYSADAGDPEQLTAAIICAADERTALTAAGRAQPRA